LVLVGYHSAEVAVAAARRNHVWCHHHPRTVDDSGRHRVTQIDGWIVHVSASQIAHRGEPVHQQGPQHRERLQCPRDARIGSHRHTERRGQRHVGVAVHEARRQGVAGQVHHLRVGRCLDRVAEPLDTAVDDQHLLRHRLVRDAVPHVRTADQRRCHGRDLSESVPQDASFAGGSRKVSGDLGGQPNPARKQVNLGSARQAGFLD
jgi:hypothetical protein